MPVTWQADRQGLLPATMKQVAAKAPGVNLWNPVDYRCWEDFCPTVINGGERLMKDGIHIEGDASRPVFPVLDTYIEKMVLLAGAKWQP